MPDELTILLWLALIFGPPSLWAFHKLHKRSLARWAAEQKSIPQAAAPRPQATAPRPKRLETTPEATPTASPQALTPPKAAPIGAALRLLEHAPHVLIVGPTNSGKTTAARAVVLGRIQRGEQLVLIDPHATPTTWGGMPAIGQGRDYAAITPILEALRQELSQRYAKLAAAPEFKPTPLTIVVDEWPAIQSHCGKTASAFITELAQEGRKAAMRLIMLAQSDRVESLGIVGKGDVRGNFIALLLGSKAVEAAPEAAALEWPTLLRRDTGTHLIDASDLPSLAAASFERAVRWKPAEAQEPADADLWQRFVQGDDLLESTGTPPQPSLALPQDDLSQMIRLLVNAGFSRTSIAASMRLGANRSIAYKRIRTALGEEQAEAA